jgi:hypothetical protein
MKVVAECVQSFRHSADSSITVGTGMIYGEIGDILMLVPTPEEESALVR